MQFKLYRKAKGVGKLGTNYSGLPFVNSQRDKPKGNWLWSKMVPHWEFSELYYEQTKISDHLMEQINLKSDAFETGSYPKMPKQ